MEGFSKVASPLTQLTRKCVTFKWTDACEKSFQELKKRLTSTSILSIPSGTGGFVVYSDASKNRLGSVLMQNGKVVAYESTQCKVYENNYPTHDFGSCCIRFALKIWKHIF